MKFLEVCSGCGGLGLGLTQAGLECVMSIEIDKTCCATLLKNGVESVHCGDMNSFDYSLYKDIDLLCGGVPCQSFSQAGKRLGLSDQRGDLLLKFISIIDFIKPKMFLIENVVGLLTINKGETFNMIISMIKNYDIQHSVLNAVDYQVAQNRKRLFIVGTRTDLQLKFNFPAKIKPRLVLSDVLHNIIDKRGVSYSEKKLKIMSLVGQGQYWKCLPVELQKEYLGGSYNSGGGKTGIARRLSMDEPCLTLTTSPCQKQTERCHPIETRPLNIGEYARIQSFPDDYLFAGSITSIYKQIGNAVPVNLAKHIGLAILRCLTEKV